MRNCFRVFGLNQWVFYFYLVKVPFKLLFVHGCLWLDNLFFPQYHDVFIRKPVFIFGHPRSATSFFHALLTSSGEFLAFKNWEIYNPSIVAKKVIGKVRVLQVLSSFVSDFRYTPYRIKHELKIHQRNLGTGISQHGRQSTNLGSKEEELLFEHILDSQFLAVDTPVGFSAGGFPEVCFSDDQPHRDESVLFLKNLFKRQIYCTGEHQIVAKMNFSIFRLKTLMKFFPDARVVFIIRTPLETIKSHLSAQQKAIEVTYGPGKISDKHKKQFIMNRYKYNIQFYKRMLEIMDGGTVPADQLKVITYDAIKRDLKGTVKEVKAFTDIDFSSGLENKIVQQDQNQSSYRRKHVNLQLEEFGLTEDRIRADFDFFLERFDM